MKKRESRGEIDNGVQDWSCSSNHPIRRYPCVLITPAVMSQVVVVASPERKSKEKCNPSADLRQLFPNKVSRYEDHIPFDSKSKYICDSK